MNWSIIKKVSYAITEALVEIVSSNLIDHDKSLFTINLVTNNVLLTKFEISDVVEYRTHQRNIWLAMYVVFHTNRKKHSSQTEQDYAQDISINIFDRPFQKNMFRLRWTWENSKLYHLLLQSNCNEISRNV